MPTRPLRPGETPPKGTAVMRGKVTSAVTGGPLRRAQVRAMSMEARGGGVTSTDAEGNFEIKELPAGRYNITATKGGFVTGQFGQRRAGDPGTPIELVDGQTADKVNFVLARGGVISGRILDDGGEPIAGAQVSAQRFQFVAGTRRLVPGGGEGSNDRTDDQGGFRLYGLPPGEYFVSASSRSSLTMVSEATISNTEADGFAPTYYPGTANLGEATRIPLKAGQEMSGANFALIAARMARLRGRALNSRGEPVARAMLLLTPADPVMGMNFSVNMNNAMVGPDGSFQFANVSPGRYNLNVRPMGMPGANEEFAVMPVTVGNDDIDNLLVTTSLGATAKGIVTTDDGSTPPFRPEQVQIFPQAAEMTINMVGGGPSRVSDDYSFEITALSDRRLIRASAGAATGWYLKAVMFDGEDVTDKGIEFTPGRAYEGIEVVFTQKTTDLSGLVTDDRNRPVLDATVVVFPANRELWTFQSRYLRTARPDTNGRYNIKSLPPSDDYLIIVVQNLESGQGADPEFLARAREEAKPVTLTEGETKAVDVKLSRLDP
ncbi:MAG: carboxypeptidase-like regulatory domain-containing protein [Acidobacteriota bacterium]|nr:carboxypeptidase-like regulatory domain-containing protein [Acidobacteriota bacterium]